MTTPTTEAGRRVEPAKQTIAFLYFEGEPWVGDFQDALAAIHPAAIEAEAVRDALLALRGEVDAIPDQWGPSDRDGYIEKKAVLAAIDKALVR
jgi:hypothetical protein